MASYGTTARLCASAMILVGLSACGGGDKAADTTATDTTTAEATAPAAETTAAADETASAGAMAPAATVTYASLTGDATKGEKTFAVCKTCHVAEKGVNRVGPSLWGVVGRQSGSIEGFKYSPANKNSGIVWTEEELFKYLEAPQKTIPGTYMSYGGMKDPQGRADIIAYLKTRA